MRCAVVPCSRPHAAVFSYTICVPAHPTQQMLCSETMGVRGRRHLKPRMIIAHSGLQKPSVRCVVSPIHADVRRLLAESANSLLLNTVRRVANLSGEQRIRPGHKRCPCLSIPNHVDVVLFLFNLSICGGIRCCDTTETTGHLQTPHS